MGKILAVFLLLSGVLAGVGMYYLQVYHFYEEAMLASEGGDVQMKITLADGSMIDLPTPAFSGIDADSSPIRFRACFDAHLPQDVGLTLYESAVPLNAPRWFDCFDAQAIGAALQEGRARAYLGERDIHYGIDRIIAVTDEGKGYAWHQINRCGEVVFDGRPAPEDCPEPPEGM